jgi:hypothetical protein
VDEPALLGMDCASCNAKPMFPGSLAVGLLFYESTSLRSWFSIRWTLVGLEAE